MKDNLIFEQPLNKRIRSLMRLDLLFEQYSHYRKTKNTYDSAHAVNLLNDILGFISRSDIKSEVIKELDRQNKHMQQLLGIQGANQKRLLKLLEDQKFLINELHAINGNIGQDLNTNIILNAAKQKSALPGNSCDFDSPVYFYWIHQDASIRNQQLEDWFKPFIYLQQAVTLVLKTIRDSSESNEVLAENGFYHVNLDLNKPYQMIRVILPSDSPFFAEISAGKHRISIRFMRCDNYRRNPEQVTENISFQLCHCTL